MRIESRVRIIELCLAIASLVTITTLFAIPPIQFSKLSNTSVGGAVIAIAIWAIPVLLSLLALYRVGVTERSISSFVIGGLSVVTICLFVLNLRTVIVTEGFLTYSGSGSFFGPLIALFTGCVLGAAILIKEAVNLTNN
jgi:hypothetical protein